MSERKVAFIIDDDPDFLNVLASAVKHPHFDVKTYRAANGYQAINEVIRVKPDVLFIDLRLPRANGCQLLSILRFVPAFAHVPIYLMTGYPKDEIRLLLREVHYSGLLLKGNSLRSEMMKILDGLSHSVPVQ